MVDKRRRRRCRPVRKSVCLKKTWHRTLYKHWHLNNQHIHNNTTTTTKKHLKQRHFDAPPNSYSLGSSGTINIPFEMFSNPILADILRQIPNPKVTSLSNHLAPNSSWGTLYVASIDKITYAHIIIPVVTARHITPLLQHTTLQRVTSPWRDQNQNLPRLADRAASLPQ